MSVALIALIITALLLGLCVGSRINHHWRFHR
jgi:hypothetical protein